MANRLKYLGVTALLLITLGFTFEKKAARDAANPAVQRWEELMWKYQVAVPGGRPGEKWRLMDRIFSLTKKI